MGHCRYFLIHENPNLKYQTIFFDIKNNRNVFHPTLDNLIILVFYLKLMTFPGYFLLSAYFKLAYSLTLAKPKIPFDAVTGSQSLFTSSGTGWDLLVERRDLLGLLCLFQLCERV